MRPTHLVTAALPYANGSLHLGHLVGYAQTDIYVRARRLMGDAVAYLCANDAHGTPIELNAARLGLAPETLVAQVHAEQRRDFARFDVAFDHFGLTHDRENQALVASAFAQLRAQGDIVEREVDGNFCPRDQRFLPDRFIRGTCPRCGAADQYGDVCERCGATYQPLDLIAPRCALCGSAPEVRRSRHAFFALSAPRHVAFLRQYLASGAVQADQIEFVSRWLDEGLRDWCISRDGPYFGFPIPDMPGKFFYVWLDAPLGYVAEAQKWARAHGGDPAQVWGAGGTHIEHVIGKDIVYFHALFWPAVLNALKMALPHRLHIHGMLTVDGEKMSKSRGTFIKAADFAARIDPQALRYYYACKGAPQAEDVDLPRQDFVARVNAELVNKHVNLFSRACRFVHARLDGQLGPLPFAPAAAQAAADRGAPPAADPATAPLLDLAGQVVARGRRIQAHFRARELGAATRELAAIADIGNEVMQARKPWDTVQHDPEAARQTCTFAINVCEALAMYLMPIVPRLATAAAGMLGRPVARMDAGALFDLRERRLGEVVRLFERLDPAAFEAIVAPPAAAASAGASTGPGGGEPTSPAPAVGNAASPAPAVGNAGSAAPAAGDTASAAPAVGNAASVAPATGRPASAAPVAGKPVSAPPAAAPPAEGTIDIAQVAAVALRVGTVLGAAPVPKSKRLLRLEVDLGEARPRQILAGIAANYAPDGLVGTQVVVVANLTPAKIMGMLSEGMVLCGGSGADLALLRPDRPLPPGATVR